MGELEEVTVILKNEYMLQSENFVDDLFNDLNRINILRVSF